MVKEEGEAERIGAEVTCLKRQNARNISETDFPEDEQRCVVANGVELATCEFEHDEKYEAVNGVELATCELEHRAQTNRKKGKAVTASSTPRASSSTEHRQS